MIEADARTSCPTWANSSAVRIVDEPNDFRFEPKIVTKRKWFHIDWERIVKKYGIVIVGAAFFTLYTIILSWCVHTVAVRETRATMDAELESRMEAYRQEQALEAQKEHWLSGTASLDAAINQAVDAVAPVIAKLNTDDQKLTEACCMLARVMNPWYPNSFEEVAEQESQWMFYDGSNKTCTEHDRELAEQIIRPYMENGIVPVGLTDQMVYGEWSANDFVLRDSYKTTSTMHTFRYVK